MASDRPRFRRVLLKLSGEALMGGRSFGLDAGMVERVAAEIKTVHDLGVETGIVIGGGNIFRGLQGEILGIGRVSGDHMGMLATIINAIALGEALRRIGSDARVMTAIDMIKIAEPYIRDRAVAHLAKGRIVIFAAGTGNPYFTTDTAAALRAAEIDAEVLLKATKVDGVYDADPETDPAARPFGKMTYGEVLERKLKVMDLTAVSMAMGQGLPILVFNLREEGNIRKAVCREPVGTLISA